MRASKLVAGLALLLASLAVHSRAAEPPETPSLFVADLAHQALLSANDKTVTSADRQRRLAGLMDEDFDVPRIASFVLGHYWQTASAAERQSFTTVFRDYLLRAYSRRFTDYDSETFRVVAARAESATATVVSTEITETASQEPVKVDWRVIDKDGYKITDISVGGISMVLAEREELASSLQRSGGDLPGLIRRLQVKMSAQ